MKSNIKKYLFIAIALFGFFSLPKISEAATLYLNPSSGNFGVGSTITVTVGTNTQGQAVNTAEANISYSTDILELVRVSQGSTFYLPSPGSPSRGTGIAYFGGGIPNPGYSGSGGSLGTLVFRAKAVGSATVNITNGKVLLNDGNGTDALQGTTTARFNITPPPVGAVSVTSTTHPDPSKWYQAIKAELTWNRPTGAFGYSFELDQNSDTVPDNTLDTTVTTSASYENLTDGTWYFHIKARKESPSEGFGSTTHYAINVDTQKPSYFEIKLVGQDDANDVTRTPTIEFEAKDEISGIGRYEIYLDDEQIQSDGKSPYTFEKMSGGSHQIKVIAFDKAGNDRVAEKAVIVTGPAAIGFFQKNLSLPLYLLFLMNFIILVLLAFIVWLLLGRRKSKQYGSDPMDDLRTEIDETLEKLRSDINHRLLTLSSKSSDDIFEKEAKVAKAVASDISKSRRKIDSKIDRASRKR